ncbi:MAG: hypothetical protein ABSD72_08860 [Terracidiphilus sp.]|jgi:hypothetical protein
MLGNLAGRLNWERTEQGILIEIPSPLDWKELFLAGCLVFWIVGGVYMGQKWLDGTDQSTSNLYGLAGWVVCGCIFVGCLIWGLGGTTRVALTAAEMTIQRRVFGVEVLTRTFQTSRMENLRYIAPYWVNNADGAGYTRSKVCITANGWSRTLASGVSEDEAKVLMDRIMEVCYFPQSRSPQFNAPR